LIFSAISCYSSYQGNPLNIIFHSGFAIGSIMIAKYSAKSHYKKHIEKHSDKIRLISGLLDMAAYHYIGSTPISYTLISKASDFYLNRVSPSNCFWALIGSSYEPSLYKSDITHFEVPISQFLAKEVRGSGYKSVKQCTKSKQEAFAKYYNLLGSWESYSPVLLLTFLEMLHRISILDSHSILLSAHFKIAMSAACRAYFGKAVETQLEDRILMLRIIGLSMSSIGLIQNSFAKDIGLVISAAQVTTLMLNLLTEDKVIAV
ncbi:MAG: hypothetical protein ACK5WS_03165, partial [Alphaproteobacteria bacterium]